MENLILVGAGASKGASTNMGSVLPADPPLSGELFAELEKGMRNGEIFRMKYKMSSEMTLRKV
jgi:hypothetical protein